MIKSSLKSLIKSAFVLCFIVFIYACSGNGEEVAVSEQQETLTVAEAIELENHVSFGRSRGRLKTCAQKYSDCSNTDRTDCLDEFKACLCQRYDYCR